MALEQVNNAGVQEEAERFKNEANQQFKGTCIGSDDNVCVINHHM